MLYLWFFLASVLLLLGYFKLADRLNIIDKPNHRSSHTEVTILGGGVVFPLILAFYSIVQGLSYPFFVIGLILISAISFYDDIKPLSSRLRLISHLIAVSFLFLETGALDLPIWIVPIAYLIVIGTINAYNFMDGINGLTGAYSLGLVLTLYYINEYIVVFVSRDWLLISSVILLAFSLFNFRRKARCFAGDVGSISIAFTVIFYLLLLINKTGEIKYIGLLLIYGLDSITTIVFRLIRGENILEAHRSHFYQYLVNSRSFGHLTIAIFYLMSQLLVNILVLSFSFNWVSLLLFCVVAGVLVIILRLKVEGSAHLLARH
jgi:UDP-GlcNAc:undecaprenyl-phosphate GlcNAc-1-phosphate transferase